jgi:rhodanese-related sulfurtransferase
MTETDFSEKAAAAVADQDAVILDVRHDDEWAAGHADRAIHWDVEKIATGEMPDIPKDKRVYTYCKAGARAANAAELMKTAGWQDVEALGGLSDWEAAGGATVK